MLKQGGATNTRDNSNDVSMNVVDSNSLLETCVVLKDSVTDLTIAVSSLTGELTTLREKVALLEMRLYDGGTAAHQVDGVRATAAETHEKSTNSTVTDPDEPAAQQADPLIDNDPRNSRNFHKQCRNCSDVSVLQPTKLRGCHLTCNNT